MDLQIAGKKALVCAASKGLGKAVAIALAKEGVELLLTARSQELLEAAAKEAKSAGSPDVATRVCDLTDGAARSDLIAFAKQQLKHVDILIHNVGGPKPTTAVETTVEDWQKGYDQLFPAVAHLNLAFLPEMRERKWGRIIAVTSLSVLEPIAGLAISNAMRSAVTAMLKTLSDEVAKDNITVNCIAPGMIQTDRAEALYRSRAEKSGQSRDDYMQATLQSIPANRLGDPAEFGAVASFLCSQQASYITGSTIAVDGGKRRSTY